MSFLLGKERKNKLYNKILSEQDVFNCSENLDQHAYEYNPEIVIATEEWYKISAFSSKKYCLDILKCKFSSAEYDKLKQIDTNNLEQILFVDEDMFYFQKITPSKYIAHQKILKINQKGCFSVEDLQDIVYIDCYPHAIYNKTNDTLYFKSISKITNIFPGVIELYKEATTEETEHFLRSEFINIVEDYNSKDVKTENRKRIALAIKTLNELKKNDRKKIFEYIKSYCPELKCSDNKFDVGNEKELRLLLWGIDERYFTKPVTGDTCVANSTITLHKKNK
ncbi:hypothetical protein [Phascolarctobacterium sp.]|uniref:hypothetical protein n=1 Tax=Phascolarctobacterium sp. TaxID=2049039 RepID=UPI0030219210